MTACNCVSSYHHLLLINGSPCPRAFDYNECPVRDARCDQGLTKERLQEGPPPPQFQFGLCALSRSLGGGDLQLKARAHSLQSSRAVLASAHPLRLRAARTHVRRDAREVAKQCGLLSVPSKVMRNMDQAQTCPSPHDHYVYYEFQ